MYTADEGLRAETSCIQLLNNLLRSAHKLFAYNLLLLLSTAWQDCVTGILFYIPAAKTFFQHFQGNCDIKQVCAEQETASSILYNHLRNFNDADYVVGHVSVSKLWSDSSNDIP